MHRKLHLACPTSLRSLHVGFWSNPAFSLHPCFLNTLKASQGSFLTSRVETLNMLLIQHWEVCVQVCARGMHIVMMHQELLSHHVRVSLASKHVIILQHIPADPSVLKH